MLTFSTENTLSLEPKSPLGVFACSTIYFLLTSPLLGVYAHTKQHLFMQNKANLPTPANEPNLSSNKHLRTRTTPGGPKKQSQSKTNWQKNRDPCQTSPNTSYQFRGTLLRAYKAPLAGVPPLHATRAHKTTPFMQNKANFRRADNDRNLSSNKHLRRKTTPSTTKKQSQSKPALNSHEKPLSPAPSFRLHQHRPAKGGTLSAEYWSLSIKNGRWRLCRLVWVVFSGRICPLLFLPTEAPWPFIP